MINRDLIFTIKVCYSNSSLVLSVKALDSEKLFNLSSDKHIYYLKSIYMEYYIYIKYLFIYLFNLTHLRDVPRQN